jgi:hypothetical protein
MNTHNGWTNYATWRVNLEMFDSMTVIDLCDFCGRSGRIMVDELADVVKSYAEEMIEEGSQPGYARSYAYSFLSDVNWTQIASRMLDDFEEAKEAA